MTATVDETLNQVNKLVGFGELDDDPDLDWISHKYHVKPSFCALGFSLLIFILLLLSRADRLIVCFCCSIVPAYFTYLALIHLRKSLIIKYLTYWPIFAVTEALTPFFALIMPLHAWVIVRIVLTVALLNPKLNASERFYLSTIHPLMENYEPAMQR